MLRLAAAGCIAPHLLALLQLAAGGRARGRRQVAGRIGGDGEAALLPAGTQRLINPQRGHDAHACTSTMEQQALGSMSEPEHRACAADAQPWVQAAAFAKGMENQRAACTRPALKSRRIAGPQRLPPKAGSPARLTHGQPREGGLRLAHNVGDAATQAAAISHAAATLLQRSAHSATWACGETGLIPGRRAQAALTGPPIARQLGNNLR